jgi:2-polyprenyl-3-methyl-5-hydroxy-6-metoxy-1,4-benzoquinol methylase
MTTSRIRTSKTGETALRYAAAGAEVLAVDPSEAMLRRLNEAASHQGLSLETLNTELAQLGKLTTTFDLVTCHNVLGFVTNAIQTTS